MNAFLNHFLYEIRSGLRNKTLLIMYYFFPLFFYFMLSSVLSKVNPFFVNILIPTMISVSVMSGVLLGLPHSIAENRLNGIYKSYRVFGMTTFDILLAPLVSNFLHISLVCIIITFTGKYIFNAPFPAIWGNFIILYLLLIFALMSLGLFIGVIAPNSKLVIVLGQIIFLPSMLVGGVMIPANMLPEPLQVLANAFPTAIYMSIYDKFVNVGNIFAHDVVSMSLLFFLGLISSLVSFYLLKSEGMSISRPKYLFLGSLVLLPAVINVIYLM